MTIARCTRRLVAGLLVAWLWSAGPAWASGPLGPNGSRIETSSYAVDLSAGPLLVGARALGMGGAFVGIAEGVDGATQNPASPAVRSSHSTSSFDFDAGFGVWFPGTLQSSDFFNTGRGTTDLRYSDQEEFALLAPAGIVQIGPWGVGLAGELYRYGLRRRSAETLESDLIRAQFSTLRLSIARAFGTGDWVAGAGFNLTALDVTDESEIFTRSGNLFVTRGINMEAGLLWRPERLPLRVGFRLGAPVSTAVQSDDVDPGQDVQVPLDSGETLHLPRRVKRPWSVDVGIALQLGPRPLNVRFVTPSQVERALRRAPCGQDEATSEELADTWLKARARSLPRSYLLISAALHAEGRTANAVGVESFLQQRVDRSGERIALSPRLGLESEPFVSWLRLRAGTYLEPSRFRDGASRLHGTFGADLRVFEWDVGGLFEPDTAWRVSAAVDRSDRYGAWTVALGGWH